MKYTKNEEIIVNEIDDEIFMMDVESGNYFGLNVLGSEVWNLLDKYQTEDEIVEDLLESFEIDEKTCREQTQEFLKSLLELEAITRN